MKEKQGLFLDVESSLSGKSWIKPNEKEQRLATNLQQVTFLPYPLSLLLAQKKINPEQIESFLNPKIKDTLPDPFSLHDMAEAVEILSEVTLKKKRISIFADYDVDGGASCAMIYNWFLSFGLEASIYIPDRVEEGYGPNNKAMKALAKNHDIIICVDCGTLSFEPISIAKAQGCKVIVVDHHLGGKSLPPADAIINPNRIDEPSPYKHLCAAGVVFLLLVGLNSNLKRAGYKVPDLLLYLDLVALATIADVVPLLDLNRAYVKTGLKIIEKRKNTGLSALMDIAGINKEVKASQLGFSLGPRINAGGRLGSSKLGAELLIEKDKNKAAVIARTLDSLNEDRKLIEAEMLETALNLIEKNQRYENLIWVAQKDWNPGLTGILASRLREKFGKPAIVIAINQAGIGKGSGRSISSLNLGNAVTQLLEEKIIMNGGGHSQAAGITIKKDKIEEAMLRLSNILRNQVQMISVQQELSITSLISVNAITVEFIEQLEAAGPFGPSATSPLFVLANCQVKWFQVISGQHLRFYILDGSNRSIKAMFFRGLNNEAGTFLNQNLTSRYHFAGNLEINDWSGKKTPNFVIKDISLVA